MAKKTEFATAMEGIQAGLRDLMKLKRFRVRERTYNRMTPDGLTQVVNLQMGRFDPPGTHHIPDMRENLYGWFTVNLGVYVPEVAAHCYPCKVAAFVSEVDCTIRRRLGSIGPEQSDVWWDLRQPEVATAQVRERLSRDAFPFLARFESRDAILREWLHSEQGGHLGSPPWAVCAVILAARGQEAEARALLEQQVREPSRHPRDSEYARELAAKLGLGKLDI